MKVLVFDYDYTIIANTKFPDKHVIIDFVETHKVHYDQPLIVFTAGVAGIHGELPDRIMKSYGNIAPRPYELFSDICGYKTSINVYNPDADVCVFGLLASGSVIDISSGYEAISEHIYTPLFSVGIYKYNLLDTYGSKKMSVLYHHIKRYKGDDIELILIDDVKIHNFAGLENLVLDSFETKEAYYYNVEPLKNTSKEVNSRLTRWSRAMDGNIFYEELAGDSMFIWSRETPLMSNVNK